MTSRYVLNVQIVEIDENGFYKSTLDECFTEYASSQYEDLNAEEMAQVLDEEMGQRYKRGQLKAENLSRTFPDTDWPPPFTLDPQ